MSTKNWREEPRHRPPVCGKYSSGILSEDSVINITDAIYSAQIRVLYRHTPMVLTVNVVNSALVALVLASYMEQTRWWIFFGLVVALTGLRAIGWTCYRHYRKPVDATAKWGIAATAGSALSGLLWGVGSTLLLSDNIVEQTFLAFVIGGMCAGALVSLSYYLPAFLAYVSSAVLPLAVSFLLDGRTVYLAMGGMTVVFVAALTFAAYHFNRAFVRGSRLNFDLSERTGELAHRTEELTTLNSRLEAEISQRKIAENQLHQAQKMEALGQLTGGIAHDFNNLLTAVIGNLELAQKRSGSDPHTAGLLEAALSAAERGATLIKDLLTFARRQPLHPKAVDVSAVVDDAEKILKQTIGPDIRLLISAEPSLRPAWVDPNQLALAILNLALNARDAMPSGGRLQIACENRRAETGNLPSDLATGDWTGLRSRPRWLLVGALAECARGRSARDPSLECRRIAGASPGQDRPARHRVAEAGVLGVAARGTGPLHHGARPDHCRRGRQAAQPGARVPGRGIENRH